MRPWTTAEVKALRLVARLGKHGAATLLARSPGSVAAKAREIGVVLVETNDALAVDGEVVALLTRIRETPGLVVCPMCARRYATVKQTGLCRVCHLDRLIGLHREQSDIDDRQRTLAAFRQEKRRRRLCDDCGGEA